MKLLLMEPYPLLARALRRGLEEEGVSVGLADDLAQARRLAETQSFDLLVMDLPPQTEAAVLEDWRNRGATPLVLLSLPGQQETELDDPGLAPAARLMKPFPFQELLSTVRALAAER